MHRRAPGTAVHPFTKGLPTATPPSTISVAASQLGDEWPDALAVVSATTWVFLDVNRRFLERTGFSRDEIIGRRAFELGLWPREVGLGIRARLAEKGTLEGHEAKIVSREGDELDVLLSGGLVKLETGMAFLVVIRDISARRRTERALAESEHRYRRLVETASEGIWVIDENERTTFVNRRMAEMLGRTTEEMAGSSIYDFIQGPGGEVARASISRRRQTGRGEQHEFVFLRRDGVPIWTQTSTSPLFSEDGTYVGSLGMVTDLTARKIAEDESRRGRVLAAVLDERTRIAQELHDDVAQSFFAIGLEAQRALRLLADGERLAEALANVRTLAEAGGRGVRTAIHALSPGAPTEDLEAALGVLAARFEEDTRLPCSYHPAGISFRLGPLEIELLTNAARELLTNAWKHANGSGAVVRAWVDDASAFVSVTDDGNGDGAAVRKAATGASTYGLPRLSRRLAGLGGALIVAPAKSAGLCITCRLPLQQAP